VLHDYALYKSTFTLLTYFTSKVVMVWRHVTVRYSVTKFTET